MNFSKKQLMIFSGVALVLVALLSTSTVFSSMAVLEYLKTGNSVNYVVETTDGTTTETVSGTEAGSETATDAAGQPIINTTSVSIHDAADNSPTATTSGNGGGNTTTTKKSGGNTSTTSKTSSKPTTKAEIASYYKTAINTAKTKAKSATLTYTNTSNYKDVVEAGSLSRIGSYLMNSFLGEKTPNEVHTTDIAAALPPKNTTSHLTAADIKTANCTDKGTYYFVTILLYPDKNIKAGYGSGSICNAVDPQDVYDAASSYINISNIVCEYDGAYCEANIDKATGHITYLYTRLPMYLSLHAEKLTANVDGKVGLQFEEKWTITY